MQLNWIDSLLSTYGNLLSTSITRCTKLYKHYFICYIKNYTKISYIDIITLMLHTCKVLTGCLLQISSCIMVNPLRHCFSVSKFIIQYSIEYNLYCLSFFFSSFFLFFFFSFFFFLSRVHITEQFVLSISLIFCCCISFVLLHVIFSPLMLTWIWSWRLPGALGSGRLWRTDCLMCGHRWSDARETNKKLLG